MVARAPDVPDTLVSTSEGDLLGRHVDGLVEWRGIPYATARRFEPPGPVAPWKGVREALAYGPICPQPPPGLVEVIGTPPGVLEQSEDCLNLTVTAPALDGILRPVMVWVHGGSYLIGSGSLSSYAGQKLSREGNVVVVRINYRMGVFGYLKVDGLAPGNLGILDQIAALEWVHRNIAAFGGDPACVTVFGQSAGADSIACLMASPGAAGLFRRAILQSAPFGVKNYGAAFARKTAGYFLKALPGEPRSASTEQLLAAQVAASTLAERCDGAKAAMPFGPVVGDAVLPHNPFDLEAGTPVGPATEVIIGWAADDVTPFMYLRPDVKFLRRLPLVRLIIRAIAVLLTRMFFGDPALRLADRLAAAGARVYSYRFDWAAPDSDFGACHCIELPFLLGGEESWRRAPMLAGAPWDEIEQLGRRLRGAWTTFARKGEPQFEGKTWAPHRVGQRPGLEVR